MAPDSKLLTIAEPAVLGMWCATLAENGVTGPLDVLDHRHGFFSAFSYAPIRGLFDGLGTGWATKTLCVKDYPGCAYIDTTVDALLEMQLPDPDAIDRIDVHAGLLTCGMDRMSEPYQGGVPTPVTINFSIPWNVAIVLLAKRLTPDEVNSGWLNENAAELRRIAARVHLHHDWDETLLGLKRMTGLLPPGPIQAEIGRLPLIRALRRARSDHPRVPLHGKDLRRLPGLVRNRRKSDGPDGYWNEAALDAFQMTFPSRVDVHLTDGTTRSNRVEIPRGGAGHPQRSPHAVAADKLTAWGPKLWSDVDTIHKAISEDADDVHALLRS
jgi:hypothetical protein